MSRKCPHRGAISLSLAVLDVINRPRVPLSHIEIAEICGTTRQNIWQIEQRAIAKLAAGLRRAGIDAQEMLTR